MNIVLICEYFSIFKFYSNENISTIINMTHNYFI